MASGLIGKFATVGGATMASRVLGFAREAMMAAALGSGPVADVFYTCFRFPNLFRRLFAEGAFNIAFVPLFAKELEGGGEPDAGRFASEVFAVLASWLLVLCTIVVAFMPVVAAWIVAPGFVDDPEKFDLAVVMTRIMFPYLFFMSLVAMFSGVLNSFRRYFLAAIVPVLLNVVLCAILAWAILTEAEGRDVGLALAWGVFVSGAAQLAALWWGMRATGLPFTIRAPRLTPPVKRLLVLMGPALLTGGVLQINLLIGTIIATAQDGANALLNYADRLNQLPLGVIGIAIGVVLLPELSRALRANEHREAHALQNRSLEFAALLSFPAAMALVLVPDEIVAVLYERGAFTSETTRLTAAALAAFATGLPAYVLLKVFQPAFFAREDMRTPLLASLVMVAVNVALSLSLFPLYGHVAIATATSVSAWVNVVLLAALSVRRGDTAIDRATWRRLGAITASSLAMGAAVWWGALLLAPWFAGGFGAKALALGVLVLAGALVYGGGVLLAGGVDRTLVRRVLRRG